MFYPTVTKFGGIFDRNIKPDSRQGVCIALYELIESASYGNEHHSSNLPSLALIDIITVRASGQQPLMYLQ
ncbi:BEM_HP_G0080320.mRNA.1.CDS.1 [Saccharomyces cerevisiae]|nr:BEM_HP_G0080320.mRNA.1.CDS.1 [Saccharomyces cerevisiae]CAI6992079.1 BEM_HP_G0080320.mRNA.1.CDS.1 [Saccharomyces cerevisiae]